MKPKERKTQQLLVRVTPTNFRWLLEKMAQLGYNSRAEFVDDLLTSLRQKEQDGQAKGEPIW